MAILLGDRILDFCRTAKGHVLVVAPFIKEPVLARMMDALPFEVSSVTFVTRWRPDEVLAGVSDLAVFERIASQPSASLLLLPTLHAKLLRTSSRCLIGSANLTGRAFGWTSPPNVELLAEISPQHPDVVTLVDTVLRAAVPATAEMRDAMQRAVDAMDEANVMVRRSAWEGAAIQDVPRNWLPRCSRPDHLWVVYANTPDLWSVLDSNVRAAKGDLDVLGVVPNQPKSAFVSYVGAALRTMPLVEEIDRKASAGLEDSEAIELIHAACHQGQDFMGADDAWEILKAWMIYFFPEAYRRAARGEVFVRRRERPR